MSETGTAATDDDELKDALVKYLNENGILAKIRAQLRAAVFLAIEQQDKVKNIPQLTSTKTDELLKGDDDGSAALSLALCRDLLLSLQLTVTESVFQKEIGQHLPKLLDRNEAAKRLSLNAESDTCLLLQYISKRPSNDRNKVQVTVDGDEAAVSAPSSMTRPKQLSLSDDKKSNEYFPTKTLTKQETSVDSDATGMTLSPPKQALSSSNSLEKSLDLDGSPRRVATPEKNSFLGAAPPLSSPLNGQQSSPKDMSSPSLAKSPLTSLPGLAGPGRRLGSLPPLGGGLAPLAPPAKPVAVVAGVGGSTDFASLFGDAKPTKTSSDSSSSSSTASNGEEAPERQATPPSTTKQTSLLAGDLPLTTTLFKTSSPRDTVSSVSEEIAEDIEVDDMLGSGRSSDGF